MPYLLLILPIGISRRKYRVTFKKYLKTKKIKLLCSGHCDFSALWFPHVSKTFIKVFVKIILRFLDGYNM